MPKVSDEHLAARRDQILKAAMIRFAEGGFHSTGMAEVIAASGLSAGAVYRYFPSKESLIRAIVEERVLHQAAVAFGQVIDSGIDDPADAIAAAITITDRAGEREGVDITRLAVQAWAEALQNPEVLQVAQKAYQTIRGYLTVVARTAQEHGKAGSDVPAEQLGTVLMSLVMGYLLQRLIMGDMVGDHYVAGLRALLRSTLVSS
jgi:AcrR family transcriptional regulator